MILIGIYLLLINVVAFVLYGIDKRRAIFERWRIKESTLLLVAALGGSIGALAGMNLFHHKTRKIKFSVGVPVILVVQLLLVFFLMK